MYGLYSYSLCSRYQTEMLSFSLPIRRANVRRCGYMEIDGFEQYVIDPGGEKYVRSDLEACARDASGVAVSIVEDDIETPSTEAEHYGKALFRYGYADPDDRDAKLDEMVRKAGLKRPREEKQLELESLRQELEDEFPEERAEERLEEFLNLELLYPCGDGYVKYRPENDPWR